jgi:hypothetical protein
MELGSWVGGVRQSLTAGEALSVQRFKVRRWRRGGRSGSWAGPLQTTRTKTSG